VTVAISEARADVRAGLAGPVPPHLRDAHYAGSKKLGHGTSYVYAHDVPSGVAEQEYAPEAVQGKQYYRPGSHGREAAYAESLAAIRRALGRTDE
jgi:putative ATPase